MSSAPELSLQLHRPTWVEIDLPAFDRNLDALRARLAPGTKLIAVVKADAYGHGAVELARRAAPKTAMFAVALLEEALELRDAGIESPILVLGPLVPAQLPLAAASALTLGIVGPEALRDVCAFSGATGKGLDIHLKLDTGMGRMGLIAPDLPEAAVMLKSAPGISLRALYTHFANASDPDDPMTPRQIETFRTMTRSLSEAGISAPSHHVANSAALVTGTATEGDYVRTGIAMYGAEPLDRASPRLEPLMRWRTEIARLKELPAGSAIGYGATFRTPRRSIIATLPVGYADGYDRLLSNRGEVLIRGRRAPVVGRVSMDLVTVDVTEIPGASIGDEVILLGRQEGDEISAEDLAAWTGTISYEIFCNVGARVPRVYRSGEEISIRSRFRDSLRQPS